MPLEITWYLVIILSMICYSVLDGFDLGVGTLHLLAKDDTQRRTFLNAIGPVWDGNEVWLVIIAGALFAGFPPVYATTFSAYYIPTMILLMGLIFRAVSIEFRSKRESKRWRKNWDVIFFLGSVIIAFGVGIVFGSVITGIPLDENHNFIGEFRDFLSPFSIMLGITTVTLFMMHGAIYLVMKTEGALHDQIRSWVPKLISFFLISYTAITILAIITRPYMVTPMLEYPLLFIIPLFSLVAILSVPVLMKKRWDGWAFISSSLSIAGLLSLASIGTYPNMIRSSVNTMQNSLTVFNSSSSPLTLKVLLIIVAIGVPLVLGYGFFIYRIFRGKVKIDATSY